MGHPHICMDPHSPRTLSGISSSPWLNIQRQLECAPWEGPSIERRFVHSIRRLLHLPPSTWCAVLPHQSTAEQGVVRWAMERAFGEGRDHLCEGVGSTGRWGKLFSLWKEAGLHWLPLSTHATPPRRTALWIQHRTDLLTGQVLDHEPSPSIPTLMDWGLAFGWHPQEPSFWLETLAAHSLHLLPLHSLGGCTAPVLVLAPVGPWQDSWRGSLQSASCPVATVHAAHLLEAWSQEQGDPFEAARYRAEVEAKLRDGCGARVLAEESERIPYTSSLLLPGIHREQALCILDSLGIHGRGGDHAQSIALRGGATEWNLLAEQIDRALPLLRQAQKLSEGCAAWPLTDPLDHDPLRREASVQQRSLRTLYSGIIHPHYAMEGLQLAQSQGRRQGVELALSLLVDQEEGTIADAAYQACAPPTAIALGEVLCERLLHRTHLEAARLRAGEIEAALAESEGEAPQQTALWLNLWMELLEDCCEQVRDLPCPTPALTTPFSAEALVPGEPYPGWEEMSPEERLALIESVLDLEVRPYIALDAGGLQVLRLSPELTLHIQYTGTCTSCPSSIGSTLSAIQRTLQAKIHPEITVEPDLAFLTPQ